MPSFRKLRSRSNSSPNTYRSPVNKSATLANSGLLPLLPDIHLPLHLQLEQRHYYDFRNDDDISCSSHIQQWLLACSLFYWRCFLLSRHTPVLMHSLEPYCHGSPSHPCIRQQCWPQSFCRCAKRLHLFYLNWRWREVDLKKKKRKEYLHIPHPNTWFW